MTSNLIRLLTELLGQSTYGNFLYIHVHTIIIMLQYVTTYTHVYICLRLPTYLSIDFFTYIWLLKFYLFFWGLSPSRFQLFETFRPKFCYLFQEIDVL